MRLLLGGCLTVAIVAAFSGRLSAAVPVGSYEVNDGPDYSDDPATYNCLEACALIFGGKAEEYSCSTTGASINHQAFVSGWGDEQFCSTPASETFKKNDFYDCGQVGCSYSAYVEDHCDHGETNYCFLSASVATPTMSNYALSAAVLFLLTFGFLRVRRLRNAS